MMTSFRTYTDMMIHTYRDDGSFEKSLNYVRESY